LFCYTSTSTSTSTTSSSSASSLFLFSVLVSPHVGVRDASSATGFTLCKPDSRMFPNDALILTHLVPPRGQTGMNIVMSPDGSCVSAFCDQCQENPDTFEVPCDVVPPPPPSPSEPPAAPPPSDCSVDSDSDGEVDCLDGCPTDADKTQPGLCGCGVSESLNDEDSDSDGIGAYRVVCGVIWCCFVV
jgi:hypothetical protein